MDGIPHHAADRLYTVPVLQRYSADGYTTPCRYDYTYASANGRARTNGPLDSGTQVNTYSGANIHAHSAAYADPDPYSATNANAYTGGRANTDPCTNSNPYAVTNADSCADACTHAGANTNADSCADACTHAGANTNADSCADACTHAGANTNTNPDTCADPSST